MLYEQIAQNKRKTVFVVIGFFFLMLAIGAAVGYFFWRSWVAGCSLAAFLTIIYSFLMIQQSTNIVMSMNHAREITSVDQMPDLWHIVEDMAMVGKVPMPRVFIIDDPSPNAFATGNKPENAAVAATTGLLSRLNREELEGVMAHEVSHIRNYDIRLSTIALALSTVISILVNIGMRSFFWGGGRSNSKDENKGNGNIQLLFMVLSLVVIILGPLAATIAQLALSRNREYLADASAVELTRNPQGLISALQKISQSEPMEQADPNSAALYIANPLKKKTMSLFQTHPDTADRIARLENM